MIKQTVINSKDYKIIVKTRSEGDINNGGISTLDEAALVSRYMRKSYREATPMVYKGSILRPLKGLADFKHYLEAGLDTHGHIIKTYYVTFRCVETGQWADFFMSAKNADTAVRHAMSAVSTEKKQLHFDSVLVEDFS